MGTKKHALADAALGSSAHGKSAGQPTLTRVGLQVATLATLLTSPALAAGGPFFALSAERVGTSFQHVQALVEWLPDRGRFGGPALQLAPARGASTARFLLLKTPRSIATPNRCRAEAWLLEEPGECELHLVLYPARGPAAGRRYPLALQRPAAAADGAARTKRWCYAAVDCALEADQGLVPFNVEVSVTGGAVLLDGLAVVGADSLVRNGDFAELEYRPSTPAPACGDRPALGIPRGWRRHYAGSHRGTRQAAAQYGVDTQSSSAGLTVRKEQGQFTLSAEPIAVPEAANQWVARAFAASAAGHLPTLALRQYGRQGLVQQDHSDRVWQQGRLAIVSTGKLPRHPQTEKLLLLLDFPQPAGTYCVERVEVALLAAQRDLRVFVDQVGYDWRVPLRLVVATQCFPKAGGGDFILHDAAGPRYQGPLVPLGRAAGANGSDWGSYYFEGIVDDVAAGNYVLQTTLGDRSASVDKIQVAPRCLLRETGELAYRFYSVQRCGAAVPGWHAACHMDDGRLPDGAHVDVTGGYHNAGDFHKHLGDNTPVSVYAMVAAYRRFPDFFGAIDRDGNGRADVLDEAIWGADWLRKMQDPKTGQMWTNVTNDIDYFGIPELDTDGVRGTGDDRVINTAMPADLGAFAMAAWAVLSRQVCETKYLTAAERVWSASEQQILTGHNPRLVFAAVELFRATHDARYRLAAERLVQNLFALQDRAGWFAASPGGGQQFRIVDEGTTPAALAFYALAQPDAALVGQIKNRLRRYFQWSLGMADNPFGIIRHQRGGTPFFFTSRDAWFGGSNSAYSSTAWAAYLAAQVVDADPAFARRLRQHAANQVHWILGLNPLGLCMFEGRGNSSRIKYHHLYAEIPGHPRGAVPGAIPNGIVREPGNADRPWFDLRAGIGSLPGAESAEPWLPHNAYFLLMLSAGA